MTEQRKVATETKFKLSEFERDGNMVSEWFWTTKAPNGETVGDGSEGYQELSKAVHGFFVQQGVDPEKASLSSAYGKLELLNPDATEYRIVKYAN